MFKKLLFAFWICLLGVGAITAQEESAVGSWTIYPTIGIKYDKVLDTPDKVYFLSANSLYSFDKKINETYFYSSANKLSGTDIRNIYYNAEGKYLAVIYKDSNIDLLCDNGISYALPEIKDAMITEDKTVNDVAFGGGKMIVATNFGLVIYDDSKHEVVESANYRKAIEAVTVCGDNLIIYYPYNVCSAKLTDRHNSLEGFHRLGGMYTDQLFGLSETKLMWKNMNTSELVSSAIGNDGKTIVNTQLNIKLDSRMIPWSEGLFFRSGNKVLLLDREGNTKEEFTLTEAQQNCQIGLWNGDKSVWFGGNQGTANFDMSGSSPKVISDWNRPESASCSYVAYFYISPDGKRIYAGNLGSSESRKYLPTRSTDPDGIRVRQTTDVIENGSIRNAALQEASASTNEVKRVQTQNDDTGMYGGVSRLAEDPNDSQTYFIGNSLEGLYVVKNGKEVWKFNVDNAPFESYWNTRVFDVNFDPQGNLWVGHAHSTEGKAPYVMLPAAKLRKSYDKIRNEDWVWPNLSDMQPKTKDFLSLFAKKSRYAFFINGAYDGALYVLNTKGTYDNVKDDVCYRITALVDQDGNTLQPEYYYSLAEDQQGRIWIGTSQGIYYISPAGGIDDNSTVIRPKVPRNDGTNYADFLLDSDQINSIAVDASNRKWIATDLSGLYLVSPNGDKILKHFDSTNSPLPSNRVTAVMCDPNDNTVYVGTTEGLFSYKSDSSPAKEDFSETYAYPNPVRPDYQGPVTITGLMDNSLVKIADTSGNVFYQGRSEGGMVTWNVCNQSGERVRSGVYFVYISSGGDGQNSSGAVTKIMVIN